MTEDPSAESPQTPPAGFAVDVRAPQDGVVTVVVTGAIDLQTAPAVHEALSRAGQDVPAVQLDLRGVEFLGSAGLSALVDAARHAEESGGRLAILATSHAVLRAVQVTGLDTVLQMFDDPAAATKYLQG